MFSKILVVCTGNICRSPVGEFMLRNALQSVGKSATVASAGIGALVGHGADDAALAYMKEAGMPMDTHRARQIERQDTRWADLILAMEKHHLDYVLRLDPTARGKAFLLGRWIGQEIPDPYRKGVLSHKSSYDLIAQGVQAWVQKT